MSFTLHIWKDSTYESDEENLQYSNNNPERLVQGAEYRPVGEAIPLSSEKARIWQWSAWEAVFRNPWDFRKG